MTVKELLSQIKQKYGKPNKVVRTDFGKLYLYGDLKMGTYKSISELGKLHGSSYLHGPQVKKPSASGDYRENVVGFYGIAFGIHSMGGETYMTRTLVAPKYFDEEAKRVVGHTRSKAKRELKNSLN